MPMITATKPDAVPDERSAPTPSTRTTMIGMWDDEMRSPRRAALLYLGTLFASLLLSHCVATGGAA